MGYSKRLDLLCSLLTKTDVFADVGCDHGFCSEYMLKNELCDKVIFSDVSKGSLAKAERLLESYVAEGKAQGVLGDGFFGVPDTVGEVLIAGMGGSEIISILSDKKHGFMPKRFVFQPMLNADKLRRYILENGGYIERDFTFKDTKFYDVLVGGRQNTNEETETYSEAEYEFGKENLEKRPTAFIARCEKLLRNVEKYLQDPALQETGREELLKKKERLEGVLSGAVR